jgi:hypothetical protein
MPHPENDLKNPPNASSRNTARTASPWMIAVGLGLGALVLAFVPTAWHMATRTPGGAAAADATSDAPWAIAPDGEGIRVFGLQLPGSTLAAARRRWGEDLQVAVMVDGEGPPVLEAYVERFSAGGVEGRLVLAFDATPDQLAGWTAASPGEPRPGGGRRHPLAPGIGEPATLRGLSFLPSAQLDAAVLRQRFGEPAERIDAGERLSHWLYPSKGLAVALDLDGRELLQYVAPGDFDRLLRAPLAGAVSGDVARPVSGG